jgi:hypothetical protein
MNLAVRLFFGIAFGLLALAILEFVVRQFGYTILRVWEPGRLLEYAVVVLVFVMAILLLQIRDRVGSGTVS